MNLEDLNVTFRGLECDIFVVLNVNSETLNATSEVLIVNFCGLECEFRNLNLECEFRSLECEFLWS